MNRKSMAAIAALMILFISCASTGSGSGYSLYDAIEQSAEQIANNLPAGSRVAIVAFESEHDNISDYIMEELTGALFDRNIEVADRQNLEYVFKELDFQMSGEVSDESAKSIGKFLAADMVITGQMLNLDSMYRYRTNAINVETAVRASVTRLDVRSDNTTQRMLAAITRQHTTTKVAKYGVSADVTPQTAGTFLDRGILFASRGDYETAIADFDEAIKLNPDMAAAYMLRGRALVASRTHVIKNEENFSYIETRHETGQITLAETAKVYDLAINDFTQAIRLAPDYAKAYVERGNAYSYKDDYDNAIADYTQAIKIVPNYINAYINRGDAYVNTGDHDRAIADFIQAIRINPNDAKTYNSRGIMYSNIGDYNKAIADYTQAIRIDPNFAEAYNNRGNDYSNIKDYDRAIEDFTRAIRLNPNYAGAYYNRGNVYYDKTEYDSAIADYTHAIRLDPNYFYAYYNRGNIYYYRNDFDRAIADYEAALRINPNDANIRRFLEEARRARGR
ncbi:MAG: tetratricopeptide repeat protein [Treponema sp.]|jgi:tetratricopeptide (TPR) repeat protein|nr:tetratricopeptide repeat protein [Treponema sp.]